MESLARLSPEKYGASFFTSVSLVTDGQWIARNDSIANWNTLKTANDGWHGARVAKPDVEIHSVKANSIWGDAAFEKSLSLETFAA